MNAVRRRRGRQPAPRDAAVFLLARPAPSGGLRFYARDCEGGSYETTPAPWQAASFDSPRAAYAFLSKHELLGDLDGWTVIARPWRWQPGARAA